MNAIRREEREKPVLTNEAIEVHLSYLRTGLEAVQTELPKLREKIETSDEKLCSKIEALEARLSTDIKSGDERLAARIDDLDEKLSGKIEALDGKLSARIDSVDKKVDGVAELVIKLQGSLDGIKWFIASVALIVSGISIANTLGWI
jgi:chromosome segregation ATPase